MLQNFKAFAALPLITLSLHLPPAQTASSHVNKKPEVGSPFGIKQSDLKLLKPLAMPAVAPIQTLEPVYISKLRPMGTYANTYAPGNCTWLVASRLPIPDNWGNANTWAANAAAQGYTTSTQPIVGSIAQNTWMSPLGHVAVVEAVNDDGTVTVNEMNVLGYGITDTQNYPISDWTYIYI